MEYDEAAWVPKEERKKKEERQFKGQQYVTQFFLWQGQVGIVFEWLKPSCLLV